MGKKIREKAAVKPPKHKGKNKTQYYNSSTEELQNSPILSVRNLALRIKADDDIFSESQHFQGHDFNKQSQMQKTKALELLNGSTLPKDIKFRGQEREEIDNFINSCLEKEKKGWRFLMITGSPGVGKTLTVTDVLKQKPCQHIALNANIYKSLVQVQYIICERILSHKCGKKIPKNLSTKQLISYLIQHQAFHSCIVYIEEIQILLNSHLNDFTTDFLTFFQEKALNLILIGVSNTIQALNVYEQKTYFNLQTIKNIIFRPYSAEHIIQIIKDKIQSIDEVANIQVQFIDPHIKYTANKLLNQKKGDFRIVIQFMREVLSKTFQKYSNPQEIKKKMTYTIDLQTINEVFAKMENSKSTFLLSLPVLQQILLICLYKIFENGELYAIESQLMKNLNENCKNLSLEYSKKMIKENLADLQVYGMISLKKSKEGARISLRLRLADIQCSFKEHEFLGKIFI